jgi:WD40 repeat protein
MGKPMHTYACTHIYMNTHIHAYVQDTQTVQYLNPDENGRVGNVRSVAVSGNSTYIASSHVTSGFSRVDKIFLWRADTGQQTCMIEECQESFTCMDINSDGTFLATGGHMECESVMLWKIENGRASNSAQAVMDLGCDVTSVKFSPDDQRLATAGSDSKVMIWSVQSGKCLLTFEGHEPDEELSDDEKADDWHELGVRALAWSSDSRLIASGGYDQTIQVWDAATGELEMEPLRGHSGTVVSLAFGADTSLLVSGSFDMNFIVWRLRQGEGACVMHRLEKAWAESVSISPDSKFFVSNSREVARVWDVASGQEVMAIKASKLSKGASECATVAVWSRDGLRIVDGTNKSVRIVKISLQVSLWACGSMDASVHMALLYVHMPYTTSIF